MAITLDEVFEEFRDVPISKKPELAAKYAEALRKTGEMTDAEIENQVSAWENFDEQSELMSMYGADSEDELNDLMRLNTSMIASMNLMKVADDMYNKAINIRE